MRTLHRYIIFSYLGPFVLTLFIALFVLVMQFLWLYIDDLVGKGLELRVLGQIFYYVILTLVPMALPLAILLSSIMTFGSLGEHYELAALKSSGLSLQKIMRPLVIFTVFLSIGAFFFSNNVLPYATLKWRTLIFDVEKQKPAITIQEGAFYNGINKYVIRVEKKDPDGKTLHDIMIYDHSEGMGNSTVVVAEKGKMEISEDGKYFIISLENGHSYKEMAKDQPRTFPLVRTYFREKVMKINLSGFDLNHTDEDIFKSNYEMMNISQIAAEKDTLEQEREKLKTGLYKYMSRHSYDKTVPAPVPQSPVNNLQADQKNLSPDKKAPLPKMFSNAGKKKNEGNAYQPGVVLNALILARNAKAEAQRCLNEMDGIDSPERYLDIVLQKKFTLSIACIVLFFIGAPLGAIIRKGGLGMPVVVSIVLFILYWVISITGEKFSRQGVIPPYIGMWISTLVLLPVGIFLTRKATSDSSLFDVNVYLDPFRRIFGWTRRIPDPVAEAISEIDIDTDHP
jgi:lipopolysaccharide export system permease protein